MAEERLQLEVAVVRRGGVLGACNGRAKGEGAGRDGSVSKEECIGSCADVAVALELAPVAWTGKLAMVKLTARALF